MLAPAACTQSEPAAHALIGRVLERCQGPLRGRLEHSLCAVQLGADQQKAQLVLDLPDRLRVERNGIVELWRGEDVWRCEPGVGARRLDGAELRVAARWHRLAEALALVPLARATKCTRQGPGVFTLVMPGGATWRFECDEQTLAPRTLSGPDCELRFGEFYETERTRMPRLLEVEGIGRLEARFLLSDARFDDLVFLDPGTRAEALAATESRPDAREEGGERKPRKPEVQRIHATLVLVLDDPGDWKLRHGLLDREGRKLWEQGQMATGLPILWQDGTKARLGIPFGPDPERGSTPFVQHEHQEVLRRPRHLAAVVYPPRGPLAAAEPAAQAALAEFLREKRLVAAGPLRLIPYLTLGPEPPAAKDLERIEVRVEIPLH